MKKYIIILIINLFIISNINAQVNFSIKTELGSNNFFIIQKGNSGGHQINFTNKKKENLFLPYTSKLAYSFGVKTTLRLYEKLELGTDFLLTQKGSVINFFDDGNGFVIKEYKEEYLLSEIPIYLKYNINKIFSLELGIVNNIYLRDFSSKNVIFIPEKKLYNMGTYSVINVEILNKLIASINYQNDMNYFGNNQNSNLFFYNYSVRLGISYQLFSF